MKLDTATDILEWAEYDAVDMDREGGIRARDKVTAKRLALAMRVLAIVEREAGESLPVASVVCTAVLAEAAKGANENGEPSDY